MLQSMKLDWHIEDSFGRPYRLWYPYLDGFNYSSSGVYILWQQPNSYSKIIYAGQGWIKHRFSAHRRDYRITKHHSLRKPIYVAWAEVPDIELVDGIENYIHDSLNPLEVRSSPRANPVSVNLPACFN